MKTEKTQAGSQLYFGKIEALQPKKIRKDKGTEGSPLFEQQQEDKNQLDIFTADKITAEVYRMDKTLVPEKIGSISGSNKIELTNEFYNFMNNHTKRTGYLVVSDPTSLIEVFAKKNDFNYYIKVIQ